MCVYCITVTVISIIIIFIAIIKTYRVKSRCHKYPVGARYIVKLTNA